MKNQVAKTLVGLTQSQITAKRDSKKLASQRCRARQKALAQGLVPGVEIAVRSLQPTFISLEKMKMTLTDGTVVRANKNGGDKVALRFSKPDGTVLRKSYANIKEAAKAFKMLSK